MRDAGIRLRPPSNPIHSRSIRVLPAAILDVARFFLGFEFHFGLAVSVLLCCPFTESVREKIEMRPHHDGVFDKFFHAVHKPITIAAAQQSTVIITAFACELSVRFRY